MSNLFEDEEFEKQLFECSLMLVSLLLMQYKKKSIDITDFKCHTTNKINYILKNFEIIKDNNQRRNIEELINECNAIANNYLES